MQKWLIFWILALGLPIHNMGNIGYYKYPDIIHLRWNTEGIYHSLDWALMFGHATTTTIQLQLEL